MSDTLLRDRAGFHAGHVSRQVCDRSPFRLSLSLSGLSPTRSLASLPFDILLSIVVYLEPDDVWNLRGTCKSLRSFAGSRPIWRTFAIAEHNACRPLPLQGFQNLRDLGAPELAQVVRRGRRLHRSWTQTGPRLIKPYSYVAAPRDEDVVWLSPITSKYALCCTKSGRVLCYDVSKGKCVAAWYSGADWEMWKCRVEFDERIVYFAMAKRAVDGFGTDCQLMALQFPDDDDPMDEESPCFTKLSNFCFPGHVISVYLLNPLSRLLSAFIWLQRTNQLGLYVLLDWAAPRYMFLNTGISCEPTREWSCIGYDPDNVIIHAEEEDRAFQFFYSLSLLRTLSIPTPPPIRPVDPPLVSPLQTISLDFIQTQNPFNGRYLAHSSHFVRQWWQLGANSPSAVRRSCTIVLRTMTVPPPEAGDPPPGPNDPPTGTHLFTIAQHYFSSPLRKEHLRWWYTRDPLEIVCYPYNTAMDALVLDAQVAIPVPAEGQQVMATWDYDAPGMVGGPGAADVGAHFNEDITHGLSAFDWLPPTPGTTAADQGQTGHAGGTEVVDEQPALPVPPPLGPPVAAPAGAPEAEPPDDFNLVPLLAVDFGFAVWLEYVSFSSEEIRVRYVTFPPPDESRDTDDFVGLSREHDVHTLEVPPEIDLKRVVHLGLDQAQGVILLGMRRSNCYVLRYA